MPKTRVTLFLVALLGAVFPKGFKEAIGIAVALVGVYLTLNLIIVVIGLEHIAAQPHVFVNWKTALFAAHGSPVMMIGVSLLLFPKLALGLSGFETGVSMMPLVKGSAERPGVSARRQDPAYSPSALYCGVDHEPFPFEHGADHHAADPSRRFPFRRRERRAGRACQWTRALRCYK